MMSENTIAASSAMRRSGCRVISTARSGCGRSRGCPVAAQFAILGQVASGLSHEPDGRPVHGLSPARAQEPVLHGEASIRPGNRTVP